MMEVDDEAKESDVNTTKATPSVTVVAPTIVVPAVSTQQRILQTMPQVGGTGTRLQVVKLINSGQQTVQGGDSVRLVSTNALAGSRIQIAPQPKSASQLKTGPSQRLILPASSVSNSPQVVTIPVGHNTTKLQTALTSGTAVLTRTNTGTSQQVLAFISPQKTVGQPIAAKVVARSAPPQTSISKGFVEVKNNIPAQEAVSVKKEVIADDPKQKKPCNCTKSHCLKLYCDCFANGEFCSNCNCVNCSNNLENEELRQKAIKQCLIRNPLAFHPKIGKGESAEIRRHQKGCNCKRSGCLKNYCECFEAKITCGSMCKCVGCKNSEENPMSKSLMSLADAAMVRTMQQSAATDRLAERLHNLTSAADSNKTRELLRAHLTVPVVQGVLDCLLAQCREAEAARCKIDTTEKVVMEEFGRCLNRIIAGSSANNQL